MLRSLLFFKSEFSFFITDVLSPDNKKKKTEFAALMFVMIE